MSTDTRVDLSAINRTYEQSTAAMEAGNYSRTEEDWRHPSIKEDETIVFSECGRVLRRDPKAGVDYRSHYFAVIRPKYGPLLARVHHGGGEETLDLGYGHAAMEKILAALDSDSRYLLLHQLFKVKRDGEIAARDRTAKQYADAFIAGRLKKRKQRGSDKVKVWIDGAWDDFAH